MKELIQLISSVSGLIFALALLIGAFALLKLA